MYIATYEKTLIPQRLAPLHSYHAHHIDEGKGPQQSSKYRIISAFVGPTMEGTMPGWQIPALRMYFSSPPTFGTAPTQYVSPASKTVFSRGNRAYYNLLVLQRPHTVSYMRGL